jgi:hypothetical protein
MTEMPKYAPHARGSGPLIRIRDGITAANAWKQRDRLVMQRMVGWLPSLHRPERLLGPRQRLLRLHADIAILDVAHLAYAGKFAVLARFDAEAV